MIMSEGHELAPPEAIKEKGGPKWCVTVLDK